MINLLKEKFQDFFTLLSVLYFLGFIITKTYLLRYKIHNIDLLQAKYISVGTFFLINLVIVCLPFLLNIYFPDSLQKKENTSEKGIIDIGKSWLKVGKTLKFLFLSLFGIGLSHTLIYRSFEKNWTLGTSLELKGLENSLKLFFPLFTWYYLMLFFIALTLYLLFNQNDDYKYLRKQKLIEIPIQYIMISILTVCSLTAIKNYSYYVYPNVTPALGGGIPKQVQIITSNSEEVNIPEKLLPKESSISNDKHNISQEVFLLEETSESYFILVCNKNIKCDSVDDLSTLQKDAFNTIQIKKELVQGIVY